MVVMISITSCQKEVIVDTTKPEILEDIIKYSFKGLNMPGLAYVAVKEDSIVFMGARGYANIEKKVPFTPQTRMVIASISKTMAVTAIMQLYERGLINLDADINQYLPFVIKNPNFQGDSITVKMLLTHTSSISDAGYKDAYFYLFGYVDYPQPLGDFFKDYLVKDGQYYTAQSFSKEKPGVSYSYSNVGAALLAYIVEKVSEQDYNTYCKKNIFTPLGMTRTTWFFSETPQSEVAIPYADASNHNPSNPFFTYPTYPDGHLITTVEDLSKFLRAYIMDGTFKGHQLLKPATVELILQQHFLTGEGKQGLIFYEKKFGKYTVWGHNGGDPGVSTDLYFDKDLKIGYIQFNNRSLAYPTTLGKALLDFANQ